MFLSEDSFKKYSLFGTFDSQLNFTQSNLNSNTNFEVLKFLKQTNQSTSWYSILMEKLIDKPLKLKQERIKNYEQKPRYISHHPVRKMEPVSEQEATEPKIKPQQTEPTFNDENLTEQFSYSPRSPGELMEQKNEESREPIKVKKELDKSPVKEMPTDRNIKVERIERMQQTPAEKRKAKETSRNAHQEKVQDPLIHPTKFQNTYPWCNDRRALDIMKKWYPVRFKLAYPQKSSLNTYEQKEFLNLHAKFQSRTHLTQGEVKAYKLYLHLKHMVDKERLVFMEYAKRYFDSAAEDYEYINPVIVKYLNEMLLKAQQFSLEFDRYYLRLTEFSYNQLDFGHHRASLEIKHTLIQLGSVPKIILPTVNNGTHPLLMLAYNELIKRGPLDKLSKTPISKDTNAEKLAVKYKSEIVMSGSAFVSLIYHLSNENSDELKLPVIVKNVKSLDGGIVERVVFIEKALLPRSLSAREKNEKFFKRSLIASLVKPQITKDSRRGKVNPTTTTTTMDKSVNESESVGLETFGVSEAKVSSEEKESTAKRNRSSVSGDESKLEPQSKKVRREEPIEACKEDSNPERKEEASTNIVDSSDYEDYEEEEEDHLLIVENKAESDNTGTPVSPAKHEEMAIASPSHELEENGPKLFQPKVIPLEKVKEKVEKKKVESEEEEVKSQAEIRQDENLNIFDLISKVQEKMSSVPSNSTPKNPMATILSKLNVQTPTKSQVPAENPKEYNLVENMHGNVNYNLWEFNSNNQSYKVIIRSSTHGYINTETSSGNAAVLYPKLEYQPQFGCEVLSQKDYSKIWAKSFIRKSCDVFLCRINVFTNRFVTVSTINNKNMDFMANFNPQLAMNRMKNLFDKVRSLEEGNYLISKDLIEKNFCILKSSTADGFDLQEYYKETGSAEKMASWLPIDTDIFLPFHYKLSRVPGLFEPEPSRKPSAGGSGGGGGGSGQNRRPTNKNKRKPGKNQPEKKQ